MQKINNLFLIFTLINLFGVKTSVCMKHEVPAAKSGDGLFRPVTIRIPLKPSGQNAPTVDKQVYIAVPSNIPKSDAPTPESFGIPADIANSVLGTVRAVQYIQENEDMQKAVSTCVALMFENDQNWHFPHLEPCMQRVNPELLALMKMKQTYLMYSPITKQLLLRWDLGQHEGGWGFDKVIEIQHIPDHPRQGTCSELTVQYHNERKNIHGKVPLDALREMYQVAGKKTKITRDNIQGLHRTSTQDAIDTLQLQDVVAMAQFYVSKPENINSVTPEQGDAPNSK